MKEQYIAKLTIKGLPEMEELELRDLIIWLEDKTKELRDVYSKPLPSKDYSQIYTSRFIKND